MENKKLSNLMLLSNLVCTLFYSMSYPYIYSMTMKVVSKGYISFEQIGCCLGTVVFGIIWNKYGDKLFQYFSLIIIAETIATILFIAYTMYSGDLKIYFILNILICALITRNMWNGGIRLRAKVHPDEKTRERYDNNCNIVNSIGTLGGAAIAIVFSFKLNTLLIFALIGGIFDNFCYYYIYKKVRNRSGK